MTAYLERSEPVTVLTRHRLPSKTNPPAPVPAWLAWGPWRHPEKGPIPVRPGAPRNVLIRRESGELVVRSFRGLRRPT
ncbi:hypothetical protein E1264_38090 [Actinomadura sp. KC216]|uniref:hypothetical protein n=1 Tax=Actinomadura sp. KC216 TaxID=2530370 RepID=UPI001048011B|nr:hypothetical protein [Actinomadura sp. KC216]TDB76801.1 hypothetical protein E1264_38090 [Actinomadura sp. KC216]